jgi:hypothetical protein
VTEHESNEEGPELDDPQLEAQRAEEAAKRERESRESDQTKYEELADRAEEEAYERAAKVGDVPDEVE